MLNRCRPAAVTGAAVALAMALAAPTAAQATVPPSPPEPPPAEPDSALWLAATTGEVQTDDGYRGFEVRVVEGRTRVYPGDWADVSNLEVIVFDVDLLPQGGEIQRWYEGRVDLEAGEYQVDQLREAAVATTVRLAGTECTIDYGPPVDPPEPVEPIPPIPEPGGESGGLVPGDDGEPGDTATFSECVDLEPEEFTVEVQWRGRGPVNLNSHHECYFEFDPYYVCVWDRNRNRDARVIGEINGPIDFQLDRSHGVLSRDAHRARFRLRPI